LIATAKEGFRDVGPEISLEEVARRAGVGIGTLYRHFPSRDALVEAVYQHEVEQLSQAAPLLLAKLAPEVALHDWMRLFIAYISSKKIIAPALATMVGGPTELYENSGKRLTEAMEMLVHAARDAGSIDPATDPIDVMRGLIGFAYTNIGDNWDARALRLIDMLMVGIRR
jgi:AcrR family transcriptional regulator